MTADENLNEQVALALRTEEEFMMEEEIALLTEACDKLYYAYQERTRKSFGMWQVD